MGLLDGLLKKVSTAAGGANSDTIGSIYELLNSNKVGGVEGLLGKLSNSGLGKVSDSWVSTGKNKPISATQLNKALGSDVVEQLASKLGLSNKTTLATLTRYLPLIVDKLTPDGKASSAKNMDIKDILGSLLKL